MRICAILLASLPIVYLATIGPLVWRAASANGAELNAIHAYLFPVMYLTTPEPHELDPGHCQAWISYIEPPEPFLRPYLLAYCRLFGETGETGYWKLRIVHRFLQ